MSSGSEVNQTDNPNVAAKVRYDKLAHLKNEETRKYLEEKYVGECLSTYEIARLLGMNSSKVRRLLIYHGIAVRSHREAQKLAMEKGKNEHPTQGRKRSEEEKSSIAKGMARLWKGLTEEQRSMRVEVSRRQWELMSERERQELSKKAHQGLLTAAKHGSKLEKHLAVELRARGYEVQFHRQFLFDSDKMHIDIFLPSIGVAIECDGVFHFKAIHSETELQKNILADEKKTGAILNAGYRLLRIRQYANTMTRYLLQETSTKVLEALEGPVELVTIEIGEKKQC